MKKIFMPWLSAMMLLLGLQSASYAQLSPMNSPMSKLSSTGTVTTHQILSYNNGYIVVGKFTGNMSALGHTISSLGGEDAFAAMYITSIGGTPLAAPTLASIIQLGGNGQDEFTAGDNDNAYFFLGGAHNSSNTINIKLYRQNYAASSFSLPNLSKSNTDRIGFIARLNIMGANSANSYLNPNPSSIKIGKVTTIYNENASIKGVSYVKNGGTAAVFVTGESVLTPTFFGSNLSGTTVSTICGPFIARFNNDLLYQSSVGGMLDPNNPLYGQGNFIKAVAFGTGFQVYNSGTYSGTLMPGVGYPQSPWSVYIAKANFPATGAPSWNWGKTWLLNGVLPQNSENRGLVVTPNSVIVLNHAQVPLGSTYRSYIVSYDINNGAVNYTNGSDYPGNHRSLSYNSSSNSLYIGGSCTASAAYFYTSAQDYITIPFSSAPCIYMASYNPATGYCTNVWTGSMTPASTASGSCTSLHVNGCKLVCTGSFQGALLGQYSTTSSGYLATADFGQLESGVSSTISFCPGDNFMIGVSATPSPTNVTWSTTASGVTISPAGISAEVIIGANPPSTFIINVSAMVGSCPRSTYYKFARYSGCAEGENEDRYDGSAPTYPEIQVSPNPFYQSVTLSGVAGAQQVEILNLEGRVVFSQQATDSDVIEVSTSNWAAGMYLYRILNANNEITVGKLVKSN